MKKFKKMLGLLLALTMMLAMSTNVFAAGTLKIANRDEGATYEAYKIFAAHVDDKDNVTYTLADQKVADILIDASKPGKAKEGVVGLTFTGDTVPYNVVIGNTFRAEEFAAFLTKKDVATGKAPFEKLTKSDNWTELEAGYYLVVSKKDDTAQEKAMLTTVLDGQTVQIQDKNDMPFDKTIVNGNEHVKEEGVELGDVINFEIKGKVPSDRTGHETYIYLVSDKMDEGLTFNEDLAVTIGGNPVTIAKVEDATAILTGNQYRYNANDKTFELSLDMLKVGANNAIAYANNAPILITYTGTVNEKAAGTVTENNAVLEYGNNPNQLTIKDSQTKVYTTKLVIDKFETGAPEQKLSGAKFVLTKTEDNKVYYYGESVSGETTWAELPDGKDKVTELEHVDEDVNKLVAKEAVNDNPDTPDVHETAPAVYITIKETDANGAAEFKGLADGKNYQLIEIAPPAGYTQIEPKSIEIDGSASTAVGLSDDQVTQILTVVENISNTPGTNLPSTGGIGTTIFYLVGSVLVLGALVVTFTRRRMAA